MNAIIHYALLDSANASLTTIGHVPPEGAVLRGFSLHDGASRLDATMMVWLRQERFTMVPVLARMLYDVRTAARPILVTSTSDFRIEVQPERLDGEPHHVTVYLDRRAT